MAEDDELTDEEVLASIPRPTTYGDCMAGGHNEARPCPFVSCRHHLYLTVSQQHGEFGGVVREQIHIANSLLQPWEMTESCSLDVAGDGPLSSIQVAAIVYTAPQHVTQTERKALHQLGESKSVTYRGLVEHADGLTKLRVVA